MKMQKSKFTDKEEQKLINFVKENECIYNVKHPDYRDSALKRSLWRTLATDLGRTVAECIKKWCNIREYYYKTKYAKQSEGATWVYKFKRIENLSFLGEAPANTSGVKKKTVTNVEQKTKEEEPKIKEYSDSIEMYDSNGSEIPSNENLLNIFTQNSNINEEDFSHTPISTTQQIIKTEVHYDDIGVEEVNISKCSCQEKVAPSSSREPTCVQKYFSSLCALVESFPLKDQIEVKMRLNEIVYNKELEIANRENC